jgi:hypothetical protein
MAAGAVMGARKQGSHIGNHMVRIGCMLEAPKDWDTCPAKIGGWVTVLSM